MEVVIIFIFSYKSVPDDKHRNTQYSKIKIERLWKPLLSKFHNLQLELRRFFIFFIPVLTASTQIRGYVVTLVWTVWLCCVHVDVDRVISLAQSERPLQVTQFFPLVDDVDLVVTMETTHGQLVSCQHVRLVRHPLVLQEVKDTTPRPAAVG